jgi:hypothetical protein
MLEIGMHVMFGQNLIIKTTVAHILSYVKAGLCAARFLAKGSVLIPHSAADRRKAL